MMEEKYREFVKSTDYSEAYHMVPAEVNLVANFLESLTPGEMENLLRYKEAQKVVDGVLSSL